MPTFDPALCKPWDFGDAEDETRPYGCRVCGWFPELPESHAEKQQEAKVRGARNETRDAQGSVKACLETRLEKNSVRFLWKSSGSTNKDGSGDRLSASARSRRGRTRRALAAHAARGSNGASPSGVAREAGVPTPFRVAMVFEELWEVALFRAART